MTPDSAFGEAPVVLLRSATDRRARDERRVHELWNDELDK
jgi:hypothetical protein